MISAGLLITDGVRFLAELPTGRTKSENNYDLPKGNVEENEDFLTCAFREAREETGYSFDKYKTDAVCLFYLPVKYRKDKDIILFMIKLKPEDMPDIKSYKCDSFFPDKNGKMIPEVASFDYKPLKEITKWLFKSYISIFNFDIDYIYVKNKLQMIMQTAVETNDVNMTEFASVVREYIAFVDPRMK